MEEGNIEACSKIVDSMFQLFRAQRFSTQAVISALASCIAGIVRVIKDMGGGNEERKQFIRISELGQRNWGFRELKGHFVHAVAQGVEQMAALRQELGKGNIEKIKKYRLL